MKYTLLLAILPLALCACATEPKGPFKGPNGRDAYQLRCSTSSMVANCYEEAARLCKEGYAIANNGPNDAKGKRQDILIECK